MNAAFSKKIWKKSSPFQYLTSWGFSWSTSKIGWRSEKPPLDVTHAVMTCLYFLNAEEALTPREDIRFYVSWLTNSISSSSSALNFFPPLKKQTRCESSLRTALSFLAGQETFHLFCWLHLVWWLETCHIPWAQCTRRLSGGINVQCAGRVGVFKASFVRVRRNSARLSISLSQVTVSRESCCSGTKRPRRPGPRAAAPADSWARRRCDSGAELGRRASYHTGCMVTWLLSGSAAAQQWLRENGRSHRVTVTTTLLLLT